MLGSLSGGRFRERWGSGDAFQARGLKNFRPRRSVSGGECVLLRRNETNDGRPLFPYPFLQTSLRLLRLFPQRRAGAKRRARRSDAPRVGGRRTLPFGSACADNLFRRRHAVAAAPRTAAGAHGSCRRAARLFRGRGAHHGGQSRRPRRSLPRGPRPHGDRPPERRGAIVRRRGPSPDEPASYGGPGRTGPSACAGGGIPER